jgi:hypothetical protein
MADNRMRHALITRFEQMCKTNGLPKPVINRVTEKWSADDLLQSFDHDDLINAMEYYFRIDRSPTWTGYCRKADRLIQSMKAQKEDIRLRAEMREKTREWRI